MLEIKFLITGNWVFIFFSLNKIPVDFFSLPFTFYRGNLIKWVIFMSDIYLNE